MSASIPPSPDRIDDLKLEQIINDIAQKRADYMRKEQERRVEPLKIVIAAITSAAALVGAGIALGAFIAQHH